VPGEIDAPPGESGYIIVETPFFFADRGFGSGLNRE
jgi:hypothetical protein